MILLGNTVWALGNAVYWLLVVSMNRVIFIPASDAVLYALNLTVLLGIATSIATITQRCSGGVALFVFAMEAALLLALFWIAQSIGYAA